MRVRVRMEEEEASSNTHGDHEDQLDHPASMQTCFSVLDPLQASPPWKGSGLLHARVRVLWLLASQADQCDQSLQPPAVQF